MPFVSAENRKLVAARFSNAAGAYDSFAKHHRMIASRLVQFYDGIHPNRILEIGCGTGILSDKVRWLFPTASKVFTDGAPGMVKVCTDRVPPSFLVRHTTWDFEETACSNRYDLVTSSCALQWLCRPGNFCSKLASLVSPGGFTVHAIPVEGMLREFENSFRESDTGWNSLYYLPPGEWDTLFESSGFSVIESKTLDFTVDYPSPVEALRAVRGIGASLTGHEGAVSLPVTKLKRALTCYRTEYSDERGMVPSSYRVHFIKAKRN